jgi:hypothetical protein
MAAQAQTPEDAAPAVGRVHGPLGREVVMKGAVYKGVRLMPGSKSLELYEKGEFKALDRHLKELDDAARKRGEFI